MAKSKGARIRITLEHRCEQGVYRYHTTKNRRNTIERIEALELCLELYEEGSDDYVYIEAKLDSLRSILEKYQNYKVKNCRASLVAGLLD